MLRKCFILPILLFNFIYAQPDSASGYLTDGTFSIQFQITDNFSIKDFQGALFSVKYLLTNRSALRFGLGTDYIFAENTRDQAATVVLEEETFSLQVTGQYLYHVTENQLSLYTGAGPHFEYYWRSRITTAQPIAQSEFQETGRNQFSRYGFGLNAVLGGEYFVTEYLSLMAEYGFLVQYRYGKVADKIAGDNKLKEYRFEPVQVKFGFSLNF